METGIQENNVLKIVDWLKDILGFGEDDFDDIEINFTSESAESNGIPCKSIKEETHAEHER